VTTQTRVQRYHQLRGLTSRKALEAIYAICCNEHPAEGVPDGELVKAILNAEFPTSTAETDGSGRAAN
jgi:hypothetical protein